MVTTTNVMAAHSQPGVSPQATHFSLGRIIVAPATKGWKAIHSIRIQGNPYSVILRTPGDEIAHAAGFCLGEGIVDVKEDIEEIGFCGSDANVVTVTLKSARIGEIPQFLERRNYISQTSCGLCGKEMVEDLEQAITPLPDGMEVDIHGAEQMLSTLSSHQPLRRETRSAHAAAIYSDDSRLLSIAEDAGRHNALDKAVGKLFLENGLDQAQILVLSSRISYELVQKASRARIPIILAMSRPTALAVELGSRLNMTLACLARGGGLIIFTGGQRFDGFV